MMDRTRFLNIIFFVFCPTCCILLERQRGRTLVLWVQRGCGIDARNSVTNDIRGAKIFVSSSFTYGSLPCPLRGQPISHANLCVLSKHPRTVAEHLLPWTCFFSLCELGRCCWSFLLHGQRSVPLHEACFAPLPNHLLITGHNVPPYSLIVRVYASGVLR